MLWEYAEVPTARPVGTSILSHLAASRHRRRRDGTSTLQLSPGTGKVKRYLARCLSWGHLMSCPSTEGGWVVRNAVAFK